MTFTVARANRKTLPQQLVALARLPVTTDISTKRGRLTWYGELRPTPLSRTYALRLSYAGGSATPVVTIIRPRLRTDDVRDLPHVWARDELCLCYPCQWNSGKLIAHTIIPWASEWLLHFEIFKFTDTWHGGGHEPAVLR